MGRGSAVSAGTGVRASAAGAVAGGCPSCAAGSAVASGLTVLVHPAAAAATARILKVWSARGFMAGLPGAETDDSAERSSRAAPDVGPGRALPAGEGARELFRRREDRPERRRVEGGAAHEGAVDVRLAEERRGVVGLDAAPVEEARLPRELGRGGGEEGADRRVDLLGVLGLGDLAG